MTKTRLREEGIFTAAILATVIAVYWGAWEQPFVQDDWRQLFLLESGAPLELQPAGDLFFRPAGEAYLFLVHRVFGLNASAYYVLALLIHAGNGLLVASILERLIASTWIARSTALFYVSASSVHLDPLSWTVGIFDLGATFCSLSAIRLFLAGRPGWSAVAFGLALGFKESALTLPLILACCPRSGGRTWFDASVRLLPHATVLVGYAACRIGSGWSASLPASHPYAVELWGEHVAGNLAAYGRWLQQAFLPFQTPGAWGWVVWLILGGAVAAALWGRRRIRNARRRRALLALVVWSVVPIVPLLLLPNHAFRYYLTPALPAAAALLAWLLAASAESPRSRFGPRLEVLIPVLVLSLTSSFAHVQRTRAEGLHPTRMTDGTNHLIRRGKIVTAVRSRLQGRDWPPGAALVFSGIDVWAFDRNFGPRVWLKDPAIEVFDAAFVFAGDDGFFVEGQPRDQVEVYLDVGESRRQLDSSRTVFLTARELGL